MQNYTTFDKINYKIMNKKLVKNLLYGEFDTMLCKIEDDLGVSPIELNYQEQEEADEMLEAFANFMMKLYNKHS